jgi:MerR family transcriptional regulator, mercuric resistance operon regulatory protein
MRKFKQTKSLTIGGLSKKTGVNIETIRYYEKIGVLPHPQRTQGGNRIYDESQIKRLKFVRRSRELGFSLDEIREMLRLVDEKDFTCAEIASISQHHLDDIKLKINDLQKIERHMKDMLSQCSREKVPDCAILDILFQD